MPMCPVCLEELPEGAEVCPTHECPPDPLLGTLLADAYRIERTIGQGGMGRVYAGEDVRLGRQVAIKVMMPASEEHERTFRRFQREARAIAALGHQHIVTVYDIGEVDHTKIYLVMEYLDGETLQDRIARHGKLPLMETASVVAQTARALSVAHNAGMVHRDLKPENVMLIRRDERDDFVKILDFGLAKPFDATAAQESLVTQVGLAMGTPAYMSPEQCCALDLDHRSDIYALGMLAYHMVCGRPAFEGPPQAVVVQQVNQPPTPPRSWRPELSEAAEAVMLKCLAKRADDRHQTADEYATAFVGAVATNSGQQQALLLGAGSLPSISAVPPAPGAARTPGVGPLTGAIEELEQAQAHPAARLGAPPSRKPRYALWIAAALLVVLLGAGATVLLRAPKDKGTSHGAGDGTSTSGNNAPAAVEPQPAPPVVDASAARVDAGPPSRPPPADAAGPTDEKQVAPAAADETPKPKRRVRKRRVKRKKAAPPKEEKPKRLRSRKL